MLRKKLFQLRKLNHKVDAARIEDWSFVHLKKTPIFDNDCLLTNTIEIWKNSGIVFIVHWATHTAGTAVFSECVFLLNHVIGSNIKKLNSSNLLELTGKLLPLVLSL